MTYKIVFYFLFIAFSASLVAENRFSTDSLVTEAPVIATGTVTTAKNPTIATGTVTTAKNPTIATGTVTTAKSSITEPAQKKLSWFLSQEESLQKWAVLPTYSHNSTYGHIMGGRFFIYPALNTGYYTSLEATVSQALFFQTHFTYQYWRKNGDQLAFIALYDGFSEAYYGEGPHTKPEDRKNIPTDRVLMSVEYVSRIRAYLHGGGFLSFNYRKEQSQTPLHAKENILSGGLLIRYDSRNNYFNATKGEYYELKSWMLLPLPSPLFIKGEVQLFFPLYKNKWVLAGKGSAGMSLFHPTPYVFRFALGGPHSLRGYRQNRFRGESYYLSQIELRYTPWPFLTIAKFFDAGSAGDSFPLPPRYSLGGGLRFGLPPDYNKKMRLEVGFGKDQYNIVVSFGHPF